MEAFARVELCEEGVEQDGAEHADRRDQHRIADRAQAVPLQERHEVSETHKHHQRNVDVVAIEYLVGQRRADAAAAARGVELLESPGVVILDAESEEHDEQRLPSRSVSAWKAGPPAAGEGSRAGCGRTCKSSSVVPKLEGTPGGPVGPVRGWLKVCIAAAVHPLRANGGAAGGFSPARQHLSASFCGAPKEEGHLNPFAFCFCHP